MRRIFAVFGLFLAAAFAANAADIPVKVPLVAPYTWTGLYLGINAGYGTGENTGYHYCVNPAGVVSGVGCPVPMPAALTGSGGFIGGQIGANYQTGLFVWGVEADIHVSSIHDATGALPVPCCNPAFATAGFTLQRSQNLDWFGTVRGRLGIAAWDRTLIYGTGGVMYGEEVVSFLTITPTPITYQAQSSGTHTGWVAGGGIEYAFTAAISAKVEGLYYDMGTEVLAVTGATTHATGAADYSYRGALVRLGANLKFGP